MKRTLLPCAAALLLAGCLTTAPVQPPKPQSVEASMSEADSLLRAGQREQALGALKKAAAEHPTAVAPVVRIAQMHYDHYDYGQAITYAKKALEREPSNLLANSISAVSGLRVASKSLTDLAERNNISGSVRNEAEELAKLLRTSLGEDVLVPPTRGGSAKGKAAASVKTRDKGKKDADDPFSALR